MSPARLSAPKALRMLTAFVPVLSESSALGADRYFDYRIENYAEALSDAPVDYVIDTVRRNGQSCYPDGVTESSCADC